MPPRVITHVSLGLHLGGMEKLLVEFARHADRTRFALRFVSMTDEGDAAREVRALGWPVIALGARPGLRPGVALRLARVLRDVGTDLVHTHNTKPLLYSAPAVRIARIDALIHTRHGQRLGASLRQNLLFNLAARSADKIVSVSSDSTELAHRQGLPRSRLQTIRNGIDLDRLPYAEPRAGGPILFLGRLSREKDVGTLLRAVRILRDGGCRRPLWLAGDGAERAALATQSCSLGLEDQVCFLGPCSDVPALLAQAGAFVLPSLSEGISLALLEAMATGVPAIATAVGGNCEVVLDEETGLLVPPGDPQRLADAIGVTLADSHAAARRCLAARARVEAEFDVRAMIARYETLYIDTLAHPQSTPLTA